MDKQAFILCNEEQLEKIMGTLYTTFDMPYENGGNVLSLHNNAMRIEVVVYTKDLSEEVKKHIEKQWQNVWGFFAGIETDFQTTKVNLLTQIRSTKSFVVVAYSYDEESDDDQESMIISPLIEVLNEIQGIILVNEGQTALDGEGNIILTESGESENTSFMPYETFDSNFFKGAPEDKVKRRNRSIEILDACHIYVTRWLPLIENEGEAEIRTVEEVAQRAVAVLIVALYSECILGEGDSVEEAKAFITPIIERFSAENFFSPKEKSYLEKEELTESEAIQFAWQYENCYVLEWALGLWDELVFPDQICDVPLVTRLINRYASLDEFIADVQLRETKELLDAADLIYRLDWACVDARVYQLQPPANLDSGVVMERHKTLNWLIGNEGADWDEVDTST